MSVFGTYFVDNCLCDSNTSFIFLFLGLNSRTFQRRSVVHGIDGKRLFWLKGREFGNAE